MRIGRTTLHSKTTPSDAGNMEGVAETAACSGVSMHAPS